MPGRDWCIAGIPQPPCQVPAPDRVKAGKPRRVPSGSGAEARSLLVPPARLCVPSLLGLTASLPALIGWWVRANGWFP